MEHTIVITPRVMGRLKNLTLEEKSLMLDTLLADDVLGTERNAELTPIQELIYLMFHDAVTRDSYRYEAQQREKERLVS